MKRIHKVFLAFFILLVSSACSRLGEQPADGDLYITSIDLGINNTGSMSTKAMDPSTGFDGVVRKAFVANDFVTILKDGREVSKATFNGSSWELTNPIRLIIGRRTTVRISFNSDEIYANCIYDKTSWNTTAPGCWGSISTNGGSMSAVLKYSKALVSAKVTSTVGDVDALSVKVGTSTIPLVQAPSDPEKDWAWEALCPDGESASDFIVTLVDGTEITVPIVPSVPLVANRQYRFNISIKMGEYKAWIEGESTFDNPGSWIHSDKTPEMLTMIYDEEDLRNIILDMDGRYMLGDNIDLQPGWDPIGSYKAPFTGEFDGNGYAIRNLMIGEEGSPAEIEYAGLFGYVDEASLMNIHIGTSKIYTKGIAAGIVVGCAVNSSLDLCSTSPGVISNPEEKSEPVNNVVSITGVDNSEEDDYDEIFAGGIVGLLREEEGGTTFSEITRCWTNYTNVYASGTALQTKAHSGGLVGRNNYGGLISCFTFQTDIYATGPTTGSNISGGLIGSSINDGRNLFLAYGCSSREKYSASTDSGSNYAGDLIGVAQGESGATAKIASCWAWRNDKHPEEDNLIPGFIAHMDFIDVETENCLFHDNPMTDFPKILTADPINFNGKTWDAEHIWEMTIKDGLIEFPQIDLYYNGSN